MKKLRHMAPFVVVLLILALEAGCAGAPAAPMADGKQIRKTDFGSPSNSVLVYGFVEEKSNALVRLFNGSSVDNLEIVQVNPNFPAMVVTPARDNELFYLQPLPVGAELKLIHYSKGSGRNYVSYLRGIQDRTAIDATLAAPGLMYLGSFERTDQTIGADGQPVSVDWDLYPVGKRKELDALKLMAPVFAGTPWNAPIEARIKELQK